MISIAKPLSYLWAPSVATAPPRPAAELPISGNCQLGFTLFILLTAVLFVRPSELFPAVENLPIAGVISALCILASVPVLIRQLRLRYLRSHPILVLVIAFLFAIAASMIVNHLRPTFEEATSGHIKNIFYVMLMTGLVNTPKRLGKFIGWTVVFIMAIAAIAELDHHDIIVVNSIKSVKRIEEASYLDPGEGPVDQLYGPGIFNDPNDFSLILATAMIILVDRAIQPKIRWTKRAMFVLLTAVPGYAFALTRSRGGFLALAAGVGVVAITRFGAKKSVPFLAMGMAIMLVLFHGRMTNINVDADDTAQGRMMLWRDGFAQLRQHPLFGIGWGMYADVVGLVAHNSYVHSFTEMGVMGGLIFTSMLYVPISVLQRKRTAETVAPLTPGEKALEQWRPALLGVMCSYAIGLCSLSRCYVISTYLLIGLGATYAALLGRYRPGDVPYLSWPFCRRLMAISLGVIVAFNVFVRLF